MERYLKDVLGSSKFDGVHEIRSRTMGAIRGKGNKSTEIRLKMALVRHGIGGFTLHVRDLPGCPDFYFAKRRIAVFVDGCFWHSCPSCGHTPRTRTAFWAAKLLRNSERDQKNTERLEKSGIRVLRFWEHELNNKAGLEGVVKQIFRVRRMSRRKGIKMTPELLKEIESFVEKEITKFHTAKATSLAKIDLVKLLSTKNPYLFRAKNLDVASDLIGALLDAKISSSEEALFGHFLEELAIFISSKTCSGKKAGIPGVDIELDRDGIRYLVAVKSGNNWGNQSQHADLQRNLRAAVMTIRQSGQNGNIQPTLGICYGNFPKKFKPHYLHVGGQDFWELISGSQTLYRELIEPIGYKAREHNEVFREARANLVNRLTEKFFEDFSGQGKIDWPAIVDLVSKNKEPRKAKAKKVAAKGKKAPVKQKMKKK